ncbi:MAG: riboflavin synthase [Verrucomicrobiota bacterium]|jgi:riboflavin synthase|nr:riboflavin synthase [Verrucomicrobiota bacterium]
MMFTGLVQQVGTLRQMAFQGDAGRLTLTAAFSIPLLIGESIAVNGTCLTLAEQSDDRLTFDILRETVERTALRRKAIGAPLNLERALRMGDFLGGHFVSGHVDGTGTLQRIEAAGRDKILHIAAPHLLSGILPKGSITLDGISLTVVQTHPDGGTFTVHVIPHTWRETALSALMEGEEVNVETDMIGKYVQAALHAASPPPLTWQRLKSAGF